MNKRRLLRLAEILDNIWSDEFDLAIWWRSDAECGTVGCAIGWACQDKGFQNEGLYSVLGGLPSYQERRGYWAASSFFEISLDTTRRLFSPRGYDELTPPTPANVAARIREMVAAA